MLSPYDDEKEVLFPSGTKFKVTNVKKRTEGTEYRTTLTQVFLEEV